MFWLQMNTDHCETCQHEARLSIDNIIIISIFLVVGWGHKECWGLSPCHHWLADSVAGEEVCTAVCSVLQGCRHRRIQTLGLARTFSYLNLQAWVGIEYL